jgi:hypothetical protein
MQDGNNIIYVGAQYNRRGCFLSPCRSIASQKVAKAQKVSSGRLPGWLNCWAHRRAPWQRGTLSASVNNAWLPTQAAVSVVGPAMQALPSNGPVTPTTTFSHPSPLPQGQDDARPPIAIASMWRAVAIVFILLVVFFH